MTKFNLKDFHKDIGLFAETINELDVPEDFKYLTSSIGHPKTFDDLMTLRGYVMSYWSFVATLFNEEHSEQINFFRFEDIYNSKYRVARLDNGIYNYGVFSLRTMRMIVPASYDAIGTYTQERKRRFVGSIFQYKTVIRSVFSTNGEVIETLVQEKSR